MRIVCFTLLIFPFLTGFALSIEQPLKADAGWPLHGFTHEILFFNGTQSEGHISEYHWNFGDGNVGTGPTPIHAYQKPGAYEVTLTIIGPGGQQSSGTQLTTIVQAPIGQETLPFRALMVFPSDPIAMPWDRVRTDSPDVDPNAPEEFHNLEYWAHYLPELRQSGYNALVFVTNHPYPYLVENAEFPEAQPISNEQLAKNQQTLGAVLKLAKQYEVTFHFLVYNIFVTEQFAKAHGLPDHGEDLDTPLVRRYLASYVKTLYETYPDLGGCVLTVGESPLGCVDFCREALIKPMAAVESNPVPLIRDQGIYPDEIRQLAEGFSQCRILTKLSEEQYLGDIVGPRAALLRQATGLPVVNLVAWLPPGLFFGSCEMVRNLVAEMRKQHSAGILVQGGKESEWLLRAAFGYYATHANPTQADEDLFFEKLVKRQFGENVPAQLLLATADKNSRILTTVKKQLYSRNWNYRVQYGLLLDSIVSLPSFSSFKQEPTFFRGTMQEGRFTGWFPREHVMSPDFITVGEFARGSYTSKAEKTHTPENTIESLRKIAELTLANLPELRDADITMNETLWKQHMDQMEFQAQLGLFYAAKLEAGITWTRWDAGMLDDETAVPLVREQLATALNHYRRAVQLYEMLEGKGAPREPFRLPAAGIEGRYIYTTAQITDGMGELADLFEQEIQNTEMKMQSAQHSLPMLEELLNANTNKKE